MDFLHRMFDIYADYAKANPVIGGLAGLWASTAISFILIKIPVRIKNFLVRQFTTTVTMTNTTLASNLENFNSFLRWFQANRFVRWSRTFAVEPSWGHEDPGKVTVLGVGDGNHFFRWNRHLFWLHRERITGSHTNSENVLSEIKITMLGRNQQIIQDLVEAFRYRPSRYQIGMHRWDGGCWVRVADINKRDLSTVMMDAKLKEEILANLNWFVANKEWYTKRGLPYKQTYVLYGPPGTGKTSIIKALASAMGMNLSLMNLAQMRDSELQSALSDLPPKTFLAIEDFDNAGAVKARAGMHLSLGKLERTSSSPKLVMGTSRRRDDDDDDGKTEVSMFAGMLTLGGILNALDGLLSLDDTIIFMTTNKIEEVDAALVRKGRVDYMYEIGALNDPEVRQYINLMFPEYALDPHGPRFESILGCDLQAKYFENKHSAHNFVHSLPRVEERRYGGIHVSLE